MHITGIISEYNPLHLGHQFHIEQTRQSTGADYIITVLSGDYVQRGLPAVLDKHTRTRMALAAGSDLVIEVPVPYALSSGEGFAFGGVSLLHQLGCVNTLSFGTEAGELGKISAIVLVLSNMTCADGACSSNPEHAVYQTAYQSALKQGNTHPAARLQALHETHPELDTSVLDDHSNNMLALEYCKAIYRLNSTMKPITIKRRGQAYLDSGAPQTPSAAVSARADAHFASATAIREALNQHDLQVLSAQVPSNVASTLEQAHSDKKLIFADDFSHLLHYRLLSLSKDMLTEYREVTPDFSNKIIKNLAAFETFTQFANLLWTKNMTYARVCRNLMNILLDIKETTWDVHQPVPYAKVLGFRKESAPLLSEIKKTAAIPLITKLADAEKILTPENYRLLELDMKAAHIYDSVVQQKSGIKPLHEMQKQIVIV